jgi:hypothetical protein
MTNHTVRRSLHLIARTLTMAAATALTTVSLVLTPASVAHAAAVPLTLLSQTFNVEATGSLGVSVQVPDSIDLTQPTGLTVVVAVFTPMGSRSQVAEVVHGSLPELTDQVTLPGATVIRPGSQRLDLVVPLVTDHPTVGSLYFQHSGVYPLRVTLLQDGTDVATLVSFVHRLPDSTEPVDDPLQVGVAMSTSTGFTLDDRLGVQLTDPAVVELGHLAEVVAASAVPISIRVAPALISALAAGTKEQRAIVTRLADAVQQDTVLSATGLPLDASAMAAAGQSSLYTQWLRDGEDQLGSSLDSPAQRSVSLVDAPLTVTGATMLRDLGTRLFVVPPALYDNLPLPHPDLVGGTTQLLRARLASDSTVNLAVADRRFQQLLGEPSANPLLTAINGVADLLAARQQVVDDGGTPHRHGVVLAAPDLGIPNTTVFAALTALVATTPGLHPTTLDDLAVRVDPLTENGVPTAVDLPSSTSATVADRVSTMNLLRLGIAATSSMLDHDDPRAAEWRRLLDALPSTAVDAAQAERLSGGISNALAEIQRHVEPPQGFSFNLTGKKGTVPVSIRNTADVPLTVRVRMSSSKLRFPDGDRMVVLAPNAYTEVRINLEIRSNGSFPVSLEVFTPSGTTRLGSVVPLTANVGGLSGLGNLVTGAGALVVLTWWARHVRRNRRKRNAARAAHGHPSIGLDDTDPTPVAGLQIDPSSIPPDDEATTLPES